MSDGVELDPAQLRAASQQTGHVRDRIDTVLSTLNAAVAGRGAPWGNDKIGDQFVNGPGGNDGYFASKDNLSTSLRNISTTFGNFSANQVQAANYLETQDETTADGFS